MSRDDEGLYYARRTRLLDDPDYAAEYLADLEDRLASADGAAYLYEQQRQARAKAQPDPLYEVDGPEHGPSMLLRRWESERIAE